MQPKFSVVMPVYNVEKYLRNSIQSILNQTISDYELILVDDGSPDNCPKICDEYAAQYLRCELSIKRMLVCQVPEMQALP